MWNCGEFEFRWRVADQIRRSQRGGRFTERAAANTPARKVARVPYFLATFSFSICRSSSSRETIGENHRGRKPSGTQHFAQRNHRGETIGDTALCGKLHTIMLCPRYFHDRRGGEVHVTPEGQVVCRSQTPIHVVHGNAKSLRKLAIIR